MSIRVRRPERSKGETKLARLRVTRGLSQEEMAEITGIPLGTYWKLERGRYANPRIRHLVNCAIALNASLEEVAEDEWLAWTPMTAGVLAPEGRDRVRLGASQPDDPPG